VTYFAESRIGGYVDSRYDYSSDGPIARHDVRVAGNGKQREFEYDASYAESKLARVSYRELEPGSASGEEGTVLFRAAPSAGVRAAARTARESLVAGARRWALANAPSDQQSYCLALVYNDTDPLPLPPSLALGTAAHLKSTGGDPQLVWNPAEFSIFATDPEEILSIRPIGRPSRSRTASPSTRSTSTYEISPRINAQASTKQRFPAS
jgi:hypothetical protein